MKRSRALHLTLMTTMPVMLAACASPEVDTYTRDTYRTYAECVSAYPNVPNACLEDDDEYYGPYYTRVGGIITYYGYTYGRRVSPRGVTYDNTTRRYGTVTSDATADALTANGRGRVATVTRGGFGGSRSTSYGG